LSRRVGQLGNVFQHCQPWNPAAPAYGRFWIDTPAGRKRRTITLGFCRTKTVARCKLREFIDREGINTNVNFAATTTPGTTFRQQATIWLDYVQKRKRKPVKPATIFGWRHALDRWVLPNIGDVALAEVSNGVLKELIATMSEGGLAPKTIVNYSQVVKMVVASAVNKDGEQIYPRKWNHDFCELPIVQKEKQYRPTITEPELNQILAGTKGRYFVMFALLAGTGLRIGEALAVKDTSFSPDCRMLYVRRSIWHGTEQDPKTPSAVREIDLAEPLAALMREWIAGKSGYLFATKSGRPISQRNLHRALHETGIKVGFHAFRRFRTETLRRARVPGDLERLWLGHTQKSVTDLYASGIQNDREWRREWVERAGLGFNLMGYIGLQKQDEFHFVQAA
jgi:integrase